MALRPNKFDFRLNPQPGPQEIRQKALGLREGLHAQQINAQKIRQNTFQLQQQRVAAQEEAQFKSGVNAYLSNPNRQLSELQRLALSIPGGQRQAVQQLMAQESTESRAQAVRSTSALLAPLLTGASEGGQTTAKLANQLADAVKDSDPGDAAAFKSMAELAISNPDQLRVRLAMQLSAMGGGGALKAVFDLQESQQKAERSKFELAGLEDKIKADLGLTRARAAQARAAAKAVREKRGAAKASAIAILDGLVPPDKRRKFEVDMRKEFSALTKDHQSILRSSDRIDAAEDTAAGDVSLIFSFMKILDPGSVVRESEFATAQQTAGIPDRVVAAYNKAITGERLSPEQRGRFKSQAKALVRKSASRTAKLQKQAKRIAINTGLNPDNIFFDLAASDGVAQGSDRNDTREAKPNKTVVVDF